MPKYPKILGSKSSVSSSVSGTFLLCCESGGSLTMMAIRTEIGLFSVRTGKNMHLVLK